MEVWTQKPCTLAGGCVPVCGVYVNEKKKGECVVSSKNKDVVVLIIKRKRY